MQWKELPWNVVPEAVVATFLAAVWLLNRSCRFVTTKTVRIGILLVSIAAYMAQALPSFEIEKVESPDIAEHESNTTPVVSFNKAVALSTTTFSVHLGPVIPFPKQPEV